MSDELFWCGCCGDDVPKEQLKRCVHLTFPKGAVKDIGGEFCAKCCKDIHAEDLARLVPLLEDEPPCPICGASFIRTAVSDGKWRGDLTFEKHWACGAEFLRTRHDLGIDWEGNTIPPIIEIARDDYWEDLGFSRGGGCWDAAHKAEWLGLKLPEWLQENHPDILAEFRKVEEGS